MQPVRKHPPDTTLLVISKMRAIHLSSFERDADRHPSAKPCADVRDQVHGNNLAVFSGGRKTPTIRKLGVGPGAWIDWENPYFIGQTHLPHWRIR